MLNWLKGKVVKHEVAKVAKSNDKKTTVLGIMGAALIAGQIDYGKLISGDRDEIAKAAGAVVAGLIGYYTNKKD